MYLIPPLQIAERKLTHYLLVKLDKDDKLNYLSLAGYTPSGWQQLERDLITLAQTSEAIMERVSGYGVSYSVTGQLTGPNGRSLWVKTIWMRDDDEEITKFITLYPPN